MFSVCSLYHLTHHAHLSNYRHCVRFIHCFICRRRFITTDFQISFFSKFFFLFNFYIHFCGFVYLFFLLYVFQPKQKAEKKIIRYLLYHHHHHHRLTQKNSISFLFCLSYFFHKFSCVTLEKAVNKNKTHTQIKSIHFHILLNSTPCTMSKRYCLSHICRWVWYTYI